MLRVKAIAPLRLEPAEMVRRQARYDLLGGPELEITLVNLEGEGAPLRFDHHQEIAVSERLTYQSMLDTDPDQYDVLLPDCVLDPAVDWTPVPSVAVHGILRLASGFIHALGLPFAAVTRNATIGDELRRKVESYGLLQYLSSVEILDVDFCFVSDHDQWEKAMKPLAEALSKQGVKVLLNGCSAVDIGQRRVGELLVVDPTELALRALSVGEDVGAITKRMTSPAGGSSA